MFVGVVSISSGWVVVVVGGEDQNVVFINQFYQFWQMVVEQFQICCVVSDVMMVVSGGVKIDEVSEDDSFVVCFFYFFDGCVEQCVQFGGFYFFSDIVVGVDIGDFIYGYYVVVFFVDQFLQYGWCWWFYCQVVMVIGMLEVIGFVVYERMSNYVINVIVVFGQFFMCDFVQFIQFVEVKGFFVIGDLEY